MNSPLDVSYSFSNAPAASHADFILDGGAVQHDTTLDNAYQIANILPGQHNLAGYLAEANEGKVNGTDAAVNFSIAQPNVVSVSGTVKDRIAGGLIDGSTITYSGPVTKSAPVVNGSYQITDLTPGNYNVRIAGPSHVGPSGADVVSVNASGEFPFSVLKWGSGMFGAVYDQTFDRFFNLAARSDILGVGKWKQMPSEIYVTEEGLPADKFAEFVDILNEVNNENTSKYFCGRTGPLPIRTGPFIGDRKDSSELIRFDGTGSWTRRYASDGNVQNIGEIIATKTNFYIPDFVNFDRARRKYIVNKELISAAWAFDAPGIFDDSSTASNTRVTAPSKEDKMVACIVYHDDTHPGNRAPDINDKYK